MPFSWPDNSSPFWGVARTTVLVTSALIAGWLIYDTADFAKDLKMLLSLAFADGVMTGAGALFKKKG